MADFPITDKFVAELLALPSYAHRMARLGANHLVDEAGLDSLLAHAEQSVRHNPLQACALAQLCEQVARQVSSLALAARATYLQAQTYVLRGDAQTALALIEVARNQFMALNMTVEALRTDVGTMTTLTTLGRYQDALARGNMALEQIDTLIQRADPDVVADLTVIRAKLFVNQGPALSEMGLFGEALTAYSQAEAIYESLQMTEDQVLVLSNRGVALRYLGRVEEALRAYEQAASLLPRSGYLYALMQNNIGDAHLLLGDYRAGLAALADARRAFADQEAEYDLQICTTHMADAYLALNLYPEALALYQESAESLASTDYHYYLGKALWGTGVVNVALSDFDAAASPLAEAVELFTRLDNRPITAQIILEQSAMHEARGDLQAALNAAQQALGMLVEQGAGTWPVQQVYAHLRFADLLLPNTERAERHLRQAESLLQDLTLPNLRYRFLLRLGQVRRLQGDVDEARRLFEASIDVIEQLRSSLVDEAMLVSFQQDKMAAYEALIQLHLEQMAADQFDEQAIRYAFDLIEQAKSRALVERISGAVQTELAESGDQETEDRLRWIQKSLNAIYNEMLGHDSGAADTQVTRGDRTVRMAQLSRQAGELEQELTQTRLQLAALRPRTEPFEQSLPLQRIQADLPRDLTLVSYHIAGDEVLAFVITHETAQVVRKIATPAAVREHLHLLNVQWNHLHVRSSLLERHLSRLERNAQQPLHGLYRELLAPLDHLLDLNADLPARKLVIIPHGLLHQVPFQALYDGERYLIEMAELSYAPSATVLALCQARRPPQSNRLLVFGVSDPAIPAVEAEVRAIAQLLPQAAVFLNEEASLETLSANGSDCKVLHLACHGLFRTDNPIFSALKLWDGWLTALESTAMELDGALVVLSACESGRGAVLAGDETIGLARAFLGAGAVTLAVSQWLVQDDTGAMLMAEWYARLARGQTPTAALRAAQLSLKSSHPHPYYWAPFVLMGSRTAIFES